MRYRSMLIVWLLLGLGAAGPSGAQPAGNAPAPPSGLVAEDHPFDGGQMIDLRWQLSPDDPDRVAGYVIERSMTDAEIAAADMDQRVKRIRAAKAAATERIEAAVDSAGWAAADAEARMREARREAAVEARASIAREQAEAPEGPRFTFVANVKPGESELTVSSLIRGTPYFFRVAALASDDSRSPAITTTAAVAATRQWFDGSRLPLFFITVIFCGSVIYWIEHARKGRDLKVRKIAGLEAIDEAVGRATEMGRSCIYVPGTQDMNEMQTIASMTVLARVARTAASYNAKVEVPTSRSLVMTTARETVQAAFMSAGRPDAYHADNIYYVTDEQFGYVAYLSGLMVREKPAACFYMGAFFAESLILAETGNSIGAIQVAGTAMPAQLPFFVAACDYTLIGEEFFAASAYLSGSPEELGSLKGQDVGKAIVAAILVIGVVLATLAAATGSTALESMVEYLKGTILT